MKAVQDHHSKSFVLVLEDPSLFGWLFVSLERQVPAERKLERRAPTNTIWDVLLKQTLRLTTLIADQW